MFIQINTLCRAGLFLWLTTGLSLSATAEENCTLMTPETTLRIPGGVISAAHHVPLGDDKISVRFDNPVAAVTPGQSAVFYQDEVCLGGGVIEARITE